MSEAVITEDDAGRRLDRVLRNAFPGVPPGAIAGAIRRGQVRIDGAKAAPDTRVAAGQRLELPAWTDTGREPRERDTAFRSRPKRMDDEIHAGPWTVPILERTTDWLALNKPAGIAAHGSAALDGVVRTVASDEGWWQESLSFRPGPVHRLDRNTSGVQLFALSAEGARVLTEEIRRRRLYKLYLTLVGGAVARSFTCERRLGYDRMRGVAVVEGTDEARERSRTLRLASARTSFHPIAVSADRRWSLILARPETGRTHQVRAHLSAEGHPLVADVKYGGAPWRDILPESRAARDRFEHFFLHALVLAGATPDEAHHTWTAPLPSGIFRIVRQLFGDPAGLELRIREIVAAHCPECSQGSTISL